MQMICLLAAGYVFTPIVVAGEQVVNVFGLNDREETVVNTDLSSGTWRKGKYTRLPPGPAGLTVSATGINNDGVIAGVASDQTTFAEQGFVLRGSTYTLFSRPGWDNTEPRAIANSGLITGYNFSADFTQTAGFVYDPATNTFTDATPPGSTRTITQGMNAAGQITGDGRQAGTGRYAFIWQQGPLNTGKHQLAPFLDRVVITGATAGRGINDDGAITGFTVDGGATVGFVGNASSGFQLLLPPGAGGPGTSTFCEGINNAAQVVCSVGDAAGATVGAFLGTPHGH
jgi:hypothetical protein